MHFNLNNSERKPTRVPPKPIPSFSVIPIFSLTSMIHADNHATSMAIIYTLNSPHPQCLHSHNYHLWRILFSRHFSIPYCSFISIPATDLGQSELQEPSDFSASSPIILELIFYITYSVMCFKHKSHHIRLPIKTLRCTLSLTGHHSRSVAWGNNVSHYEIYWQLSCFAAVYLSVRRMKGHSPPLLHRKESQGFSLLLWVF